MQNRGVEVRTSNKQHGVVRKIGRMNLADFSHHTVLLV